MAKLLINIMIIAATIHSAALFAIAGFDEGVAAYKRGDYTNAFKEFKMSADQGNTEAQLKLGTMYQFGVGIAQDDAEAAKWYLKAADQGLAEAQFNLGVMYARGDGVPKDYMLAYMWFDVAAAQGHNKARKNRDVSATQLTLKQIAEAQALAEAWKPKKQ